MKKYPNLDELKEEAMQHRLCELILFQCVLRESEAMNARYHGRAEEIADGLQAWIDALEESLSRRLKLRSDD